MSRFAKAVIAVPLLVVIWGAAAGCSSVDRKTQITIGVAAETQIPDELDSFAIRVFATRSGELRFFKDYFPKSGRDFPSTLAVIPFDEDSLESPLRIEIEGRKGNVVFLRRQAVVSYFRERNIYLSVPLRMACFQFKDCGPQATCSGGQCVPATRDAATLPDFQPKYVFPESATCFDEEKCLTELDAITLEETCEFDVPPGVDASSGNVAIRWAAAPSRVLTLEADDPQEGWQRIGESRGKLSQGACDSHFQRKDPGGEPLVSDWAKKIYFSRKCAPKSKLVPYCLSAVTQHSGIGAVVAE